MNALQRLETWGAAHHPKYMDLIRIAFGIFLVIKGVEFAANTNFLSELVNRQIPFSGFILLLITHYIVFAHIAGGFMIATGLLTRIACMAQIPVLIGALIFVNWDVMGHFSSFLVTLATLALLVWFFIIGSGPWSLDRALDKEAAN